MRLLYIGQLGTDITLHREELETFPHPQQHINPPPNAVQLYYRGKPFVTNIKKTLWRDLYFPAIQTMICKHEQWTVTEFRDLDWEAHEYALLSPWSCIRITYSKLTNKLLNTNAQNRRFYGDLIQAPAVK